MDQKKIGAFLKTLRKEKGLTQAQLAEHFNVSDRSVSRWETGSNMPDLGLLVEIAEYYHLDVSEIIDGERKGEKMALSETLEKVAEYTEAEKQNLRRNTIRKIGWIVCAFGAFIIISAMTIFPSDSSWGGIYSVVGSIVAAVGIYQLSGGVSRIAGSTLRRIAVAVICIVVMLCGLIFVDYLGVKVGNQVPRFAYIKTWTSLHPNEVIYKAPFYTVIWHNPGTEDEYVEIR